MTNNIKITFSSEEIEIMKTVIRENKNKPGNSEWYECWKSAKVIDRRIIDWQPDSEVIINDLTLDYFKDLIQLHVYEIVDKQLGETNHENCRDLFIKIMDILGLNDGNMWMYIPMYYENEKSERRVLKVDPNGSPLVELAKHGVFINDNNKN